MATSLGKTERTLTASEQKAIDVIFKLQNLGFLPPSSWIKIDFGKVIYPKPIKVESPGSITLTLVKERRVRAEWPSGHSVEMVLERGNEKHLGAHPANSTIRHVLTTFQQEGDTWKNGWKAVRLIVQRPLRYIQKYEGGGYEFQTFRLEGEESVSFLCTMSKKRIRLLSS